DARVLAGGAHPARLLRYRVSREIPHLLSLLPFHDANATVQGFDSVPSTDRPPVTPFDSPSRRWWASGHFSRFSARSTSMWGSVTSGCPPHAGSTGRLSWRAPSPWWH